MSAELGIFVTKWLALGPVIGQPVGMVPRTEVPGGTDSLPPVSDALVHRPKAGWRRVAGLLRRPWVRYPLAAGFAAVVVALLLVPQFRSAAHDLRLLKRIPTGWIVAGAALEAISFVAYGLFTRGVLPVEGRPSFHRLLRVDVVGAGLTHVLPGGGAAASGVRFRMLRNAGVSGTDAAFGSVLQGLGSAVVVSALLLVGVLVVLPSRGGNALYVIGAVVGVVLAAVLVCLWLALVRAEERSVRLLRRVTARWGHGDAVEQVAHRVAARLSELSNPWMLLRVITWAAANWLFDAASLWVFVIAFGYRVDVGGILVAFGLANTLAILPVTPGGVGIVEGILVPSLVGFGTPKSIALLGVLTWRLFNFWAPIPAGAVAWMSLGFKGGKRARPAPAVEV
jgi:uncharacterized protein (TIRG00374 family)